MACTTLEKQRAACFGILTFLISLLILGVGGLEAAGTATFFGFVSASLICKSELFKKRQINLELLELASKQEQYRSRQIAVQYKSHANRYRISETEIIHDTVREQDKIIIE